MRNSFVHEGQFYTSDSLTLGTVLYTRGTVLNTRNSFVSDGQFYSRETFVHKGQFCMYTRDSVIHRDSLVHEGKFCNEGQRYT